MDRVLTVRAAEWPTVYGRLFANWGLSLSGLGTEADFEVPDSADVRAPAQPGTAATERRRRNEQDASRA